MLLWRCCLIKCSHFIQRMVIHVRLHLHHHYFTIGRHLGRIRHFLPQVILVSTPQIVCRKIGSMLLAGALSALPPASGLIESYAPGGLGGFPAGTYGEYGAPGGAGPGNSRYYGSGGRYGSGLGIGPSNSVAGSLVATGSSDSLGITTTSSSTMPSPSFTSTSSAQIVALGPNVAGTMPLGDTLANGSQPGNVTSVDEPPSVLLVAGLLAALGVLMLQRRWRSVSVRPKPRRGV